MNLDKHGRNVSKKLTHLMRGGHDRRIIITDKHNNPVLHFPILFFVVITVLLPVVMGVLIFLFLLSEYHAVVEGSEE